ncbi:hypothetical protein AGABI2DRAFT_194621 [Agaricus bisporus var. bisporus H97]|uniref:hypothetical protein n=1 Tax=Agaricus bisporus var. bisporus (strain H97 / ATCC MYA-4626 / FGSC 10389) TaxID=936046 RepID=UPI00029F7949|nr:hypothetical protein AGABI2DRAFT_194621 [Agaricus bisporus var. bisporus H97]EKV44688.1 hypothetical protein AGABI2DRAFT_194621 [Agaricus bisporus var. bisporus H97]
MPHVANKASITVSDNSSNTDIERANQPRKSISLWQYLMLDVDPKETVGPLAAYCFMTGYIDVISFSAIFVWCGFQTGNFAQLALAIARLWEKSNNGRSLRRPDQQALTSLISFQFGAALGRIGDKIGPHKRIWLMAGTFIQTLLTMAAAIAFWKSGQDGVSDERENPAWTKFLTFVGLAPLSASLGLQGILGKRLNTQFGTTIVLTTVWVELITDPGLFNIRKKVMSRDHRLIAAGALFLGAFTSRAIQAELGTSGALGVGTGFRILVTLYWLFVPSKSVSK